jgi:hypothetical protein
MEDTVKTVETNLTKICQLIISRTIGSPNQNWTDAQQRLNIMFTTLGLFQNIACPDRNSCTRTTCIFSHFPVADLPPQQSLFIPVDEPKASTSSARPTNDNATIPSKRPVANSPLRGAGLNNGDPIGEPPRKVQRLGSTQRQVSTPSTSSYTNVSAILVQPLVVKCPPNLDRSSSSQSQCCSIKSSRACSAGGMSPSSIRPRLTLSTSRQW